MKHLLEFILNYLVKYPEDLKITEKEEGDIVIFSLTANEQDYGRIIGKNGNMINSLSNIIKAKASMENKKVLIRIDQNNRN